MSKLTLLEQATNPPAPATGRVTLFSKDGSFFSIDDTGSLIQLSGGVSRVSVLDINDPSSELNPLSGITDGDLLFAFQSIASGEDQATMYSWDSNPDGGENVPYTVDGVGGRWIAFAGRFLNNIVESSADENKLKSFYITFAALPDNIEFHGMFAHTHAAGDETNFGQAVFAHSTGWIQLKSHLQDHQQSLAPAATVDVSFGRVGISNIGYGRFQTLALDQNTTLTFSNPIAGAVRFVEVIGNFTLTLPGSATVYGAHVPNVKNLLSIQCIDIVIPKFDVIIQQEGVATTDAPVVQVRRTTVYDFTAAFADVAFDTADVENDTSIIEHDAGGGGTDRITVKEVGLYKIEVNGYIEASSGEDLATRLRINDTSNIPGSEFTFGAFFHNQAHMINLNIRLYVILAANDFITLQLDSTSTGSDLLAGAVLTVQRVA